MSDDVGSEGVVNPGSFSIAANQASATSLENSLKSGMRNSSGDTGATSYASMSAFKEQNPALYHAMEKSIMTNVIGQLDDRRKRLEAVLKKARQG